jgi:hypothetical protein
MSLSVQLDSDPALRLGYGAPYPPIKLDVDFHPVGRKVLH